MGEVWISKITKITKIIKIDKIDKIDKNHPLPFFRYQIQILQIGGPK